VPTTWARIALCTLALSAAVLIGARTSTATAATAATSNGPVLTLQSETPVVTPAAPWFGLALNVRPISSVAVANLHVTVTVYSRIGNMSQLQQSTAATPDKSVLSHLPNLPVTSTPLGLTALTCVTVLPDSSVAPPTPAAGTAGACAAGGTTVYLNCVPDNGTCSDVYPVSVALYRKGSSTALDRFTTFLTYVESIAAGTGPLRVGLVMPVASAPGGSTAAITTSERSVTESVVGLLSAHHDVDLTLAVNPATATDLLAHGGRAGARALSELAALAAPVGNDEMLAEPYAPVNLAALSAAGLTSEIPAQVAQGNASLRQAGLHPSGGTWVDTTSTFTATQDTELATGLQAAHAKKIVLQDGNLAQAGPEDLTFAQPFSLDLGHGGHLTAAASNSQVDSRFNADPGDPELAANQLLATLSFIHYENASLPSFRGVVVSPPANWRPSRTFISTVLNGFEANPALSTVTLDGLFTQVPQGGNDEPGTRRLQSGTPPHGGSIPPATAARITTARAHLGSFAKATSGHPAVLNQLGDQLLEAENGDLTPAGRSAALSAYEHHFSAVIGSISLAAERTITFTSRTASIPITVLSNAPYPVTVVLSLSSDKFDFPSGDSRTLTLRHPTTPVRIPARARTSGDRLPVTVTLRTPDGQLVIGRAVLTVHSTAISIVGIGLTVLAGLVLLVWWIRTWRKGRRHRPRAS
jgi:hypothetical protein